MAEAHSAVAFSFNVTTEGVNVHLNHEALWAVWQSGVRSWKKRLARMRNHMINGVYPVSPGSWFVTAAIVVGLFLANIDVSYGFGNSVRVIPWLFGVREPYDVYISWLLVATVIWLTGIFMIRWVLQLLLSYQGWMYEPRGKMSLVTKLWLATVKVFVMRKPLLYSYQGSLPKLPVPALQDTMKRYLVSVRPLLDDEKYERIERLVRDFEAGIGPKLQRYLVLKSWWATNYISDWWEDYVYLRGRSPIMVNSNFYGLDAVMQNPTSVQAARAANVVYSMLQYRRQLDHEQLTPIMLNKTVPLCSWQYERQFNTVRVPGIETDTIVHYRDSKHIVVYHRGRYFKVYVYHKHRLLSPSQIEIMLQQILDDTASQPAPGECHLAALTAGDRVTWAKARSSFFVTGVNRTSLDAIEKAAFVLALDDEPQFYDRTNPDKLDQFGRAMLHGKAYDRWFDKSFTLVVCSNGRIGFNAEHSWADAPIMGHLWECCLADEFFRYTADGHTVGTAEFQPPNPIRLHWDLNEECRDVIERSLHVARELLSDVDLHVLTHDQFGKGFIKRCNISPDAFIQMALQLAYFRNAGKFCLTYEASMTRMFREGRTETVRSCTVESCTFVRAIDNATVPKSEKIRLLLTAGEVHQRGYRDAMSGKGIDRHLFTLYVVSKYLNIDSPFLKEVLSEPWRLSTSQTPHQQTERLDLANNPHMISAGGGFGPVADDGYGVSYIIAGEGVIFFHISSKKSCPITNSKVFGRDIVKAMEDLRQLFL